LTQFPAGTIVSDLAYHGWDDAFGVDLKAGAEAMSKGQKSNKETKKQPGMTPKEKKAAKRAKKNEKGRIGE
jgi:hypothetical protein